MLWESTLARWVLARRIKKISESPTSLRILSETRHYGFVGGVQGYPIVTRPDASYDWQEHFTMIKGNHTIKIGGQYQDAYTKSRRDRAHSALYFYYLRQLLRRARLRRHAMETWSAQADPVAALNELLLGVNRMLLDVRSASPIATSSKNRVGLYVQDSWKMKPNFTLEAGVRWDVSGALGEKR